MSADTNANASMEHYPLCSLLTALKTFRPPAGPFDPAGAWEQQYGMFTLAGRAASAKRVGSLKLRRAVGQKGNVALHVQYDKQATGGGQQVTGELYTHVDRPLSTPRKWTFHARLLDASGKPIPRTTVSKTADVADGRIRIADAQEARTIAVAGPYTVNWCLFDAVQRLAREKTKPIEFTLIDHFDQPKPEHVLAWRGKMDVVVAGGKTIPACVYEQLGRGNVPWVYWTDQRGRLLFIVAGLEAYVLEPPQQQ